MQSDPRQRAGCLTSAWASAEAGHVGAPAVHLRFILRSHLHIRQQQPISLIRRLVVNVRMRSYARVISAGDSLGGS